MSLSLEVAGRDVVSADEVIDRSIKSRSSNDGSQGVLDFTLLNPAVIPENGYHVVLHDGTSTVYEGTIRSVRLRQFEEAVYIDVACQNDDPGGDLPTPAPFGLSDNPDQVNTVGFESLTLQRQATSGEVETHGTAVIHTPGFLAGMNVEVTNANYSLTAEEFTILQVSSEWPLHDSPTYTLDFGDAIVRLAFVVTDVPDGSITETKISAGAITTPKLAANAVTTAKLDTGNITLYGPDGETILDAVGFGPTWSRGINGGLFNGDFVAATPTPANEINDTTNPLPKWNYTDHANFTFKSVADTATGSGRYIEMAAASGTNGDEAYLEQVVPILASFNRGYSFSPYAFVTRPVGGGTADVSVVLNWQFLKGDQSTTGTAEEVLFASNSASMATGIELGLQSMSGHGSAPPADAYYARLQIGMRRTVTSANTATVRLYETSVLQASPRTHVAEVNDPATYSRATIQQFNGQLSLIPDGLYSGTDARGLAIGYPAVQRFGGDTFPTNPTASDLFYRTDLGMWFRYDGTRWVCTCLHSYVGSAYVASATYALNMTGTTTPAQRCNTVVGVGSDIWLEDLITTNVVNSGGTALSASHKWVSTLYKVDTANATTSLGTTTIDSGSSAPTWHTRTTAINAVLGTTATYPSLRLDWARTGTPGDLGVQPGFIVTYRIVST